MIVLGSYRTIVEYRGATTIASLLERIRNGAYPPDFVDHRLTDKNFPQNKEGVEEVDIDVISLGRVISPKEDLATIITDEGCQIVAIPELLGLRATYPRLSFGNCIAAPRQEWCDHREYRWTPCINIGCRNGMRLRMINAGWLEFWKFAVKKAEST